MTSVVSITASKQATAATAAAAPAVPDKEFTVEAVKKHNTKESAWFIIDSIVYDLTRFAKLHPGGEQELLNYAGQDATQIFYEMHRQDVLAKWGPRFRIGKITGAREEFPLPELGAVSKVPYAEPNWLQGWVSPYYTQSHHNFATAVRKLHDEFAAEAQELESRDEPVPVEMFQRAAATGAFWLLLGPGKHLHGKEWFGVKGEEYDFFHELIISEQLLRHGLRSFSDGFVGGMVIGLPPVFNHGPEKMKQTVMMDVLEGRKRICLAVSEPYVGSDVADLKCSAKLTPDGKHYIVNGVKKWITGGMYADYFTTAVRTGDEGPFGVSLLLIERGPGVRTKPISTSYSSTAGTAYVIFDNVLVPRENIIGEENMGFMAIMSNFNHERWTMIVTTIRHCRLIIEECFKWANQRVVFGKALIKQPVIRFKLAKMVAEVESVQAWLHEITYQMNKFGYKGTRLAGAIALCKMKSTRVSHFIADEAVQIFGGRGITKTGMGKHVEHFQRSIKFSAILGGAEEILADLGIRLAVKRMPNARL